ncbi:hypothetical protein N836_16685 [Leptolyngbya sp. Heron Island J]|nr:hypothetical protein N836_16685 [Leptolyngbya sp. Heron Island J]
MITAWPVTKSVLIGNYTTSLIFEPDWDNLWTNSGPNYPSE